MQRPILFVIGQPGTVSYMAPLWRHWLANAGPLFRVWVAAGAMGKLEQERLGSLGKIPEADRLVGSWQLDAPRLLVTSASNTALEEQAVALARRDGVPVVAVIDTWYGYARRTAGDMPDHVLVLNDAAAAAAISEGLPQDRLHVIGHPAWENAGTLEPADPKTVLFVSQPVRRLYGAQLGYDEVSAFRVLQDAAQRRPDLIRQLLFAPHPADDQAPPSDIRCVTAADGLREAGVVAGLFSSVLVEAHLGERQVLILHPGKENPSICPFGSGGYAAHAGTIEEIIAALDGVPASSIKLKQELNGSCGRLDRFFSGLA